MVPRNKNASRPASFSIKTGTPNLITKKLYGVGNYMVHKVRP